MALEVGVRQKEGDWKEAFLLLTLKLDGEHIYERNVYEAFINT